MSWTALYGATWFFSAAACVGFMPLLVSFARLCGIFDLPNSHKPYRSSSPRFGGLGVAIPMLTIGVVALVLARHWNLIAQGHWERTITSVVAVGVVVLLMGICDDIFGISSRIKLIGLVAAAAAVCAAGVRIDSIVLHGMSPISLGLFAWPMTIVWIVGVTISINLSDGIDGLAAGLTSIGCGVVAAVAVWGGQVHVAILALALFGSLSGSLFLKFGPARSTLGDCGSTFIGFMLATLCVVGIPAAGTTAGLVLPAIALSIPLTDTLLTLIRRTIVNRRSAFSADRSHIYHRLQNMGLCRRHVVLILYGCSILATAIGLLALLDSGPARVGGFLLLVPLLMGLFRIAGSARLLETVGAVRRNRAMARESRRYSRAFSDMQLRFRAAADFEAWWREVCMAGEVFDFATVRLPLTHRDKTDDSLSWHHPNSQLADFDRMSAVIPLRDRRASASMRLHIVVATHTSLESAGNRLALFSRLMEEHHPAALPVTPDRRPSGLMSGALAANAKSSEYAATQLRRPVAEEIAVRTRGEKTGLNAADVNLIIIDMKAGTRTKAARELVAKPQRTALHLLNSAIDQSSGNRQLGGLPAQLRVAIVHDFLYCYAGAEKVLEQIIKLFPQADLFSLVDFLPHHQRDFILGKPVKTSIIQKLPLARRNHRSYLPFMPFAVEQLDVSGYDLVLSSSYLAAKGIMTGPDQLHICYCHTPPRFAWDLQHQYLKESGLVSGLKSLLTRAVLHYVRNWDTHSANGVDVFATNSDFVGRRIEKVYRRSSKTIYPPVAVEGFAAAKTEYGDREDFYMTASRMVPYKRIDLIIDTFNAMPDRRLLVVGEGPMLEKMRSKAGPNVRVVGHQSFENLKRYMHLARAFIFAAEEDFGIVPVEAQACGTPVIAFGRGGVTESVVSGKTGVFFSNQSVESLKQAVEEFEAVESRGGWDAEYIRQNADRFSIARFREEYLKLVTTEWGRFSERRQRKPALTAIYEQSEYKPQLKSGDSVRPLMPGVGALGETVMS